MTEHARGPLGKKPIVVHDARGEPKEADLATCSECGGETFLIYWIGGVYRHLQCAGCGASYCQHEGPCSR
jgi:hypothetical protein